MFAVVKNILEEINDLFVWLISHQPTVLFCQQYFSLKTNQHQPSAKLIGRKLQDVSHFKALFFLP
jgi:hypothetical protein